ncbi:MAG: glutamine-hydrolyzing GMP synthase, partial [Chloroflexi bacterium]|nr:glutamine-hydrolyzing GMP synthase [Chloroflexota bacterium]
MSDRILVIDFGSQFTQMIARRVRDLEVYCELLPWSASPEQMLTPETRGVILSGGPNSVYAPDAPQIPDPIINSGLPILGICYGMQALTHKLGGVVSPSEHHEYGQTQIEVLVPNKLLSEPEMTVLMSHGDRIIQPPAGWRVIARSTNSPVAAMADFVHKRFGLQFHPEAHPTPDGIEIFRHFVIDICRCQPDWTSESIIQEAADSIRQQVGKGRVLSAVSGGVDSSVATTLVQHALGDHVECVFIDTGLMRLNEAAQVEAVFRPILGEHLHMIDSSARFLGNLKGVTDPEQKRKIVGETFIREFERVSAQFGDVEYLCQGTIYPDVIESQGVGAKTGRLIKSHHNVGGLPKDLRFKLVEPLRMLFKDEVRHIGEALGLPHDLLWRQPFPGPGLAVRVLGEVTAQRVRTLQEADAIFQEELAKASLLSPKKNENGEQIGSSQAFAVLLPVKSVGVMGDQRTYAETVCLRAITTNDFMTAEWSRLPYSVLARASNRIINEVSGVNRAVYDITNKPPATIEWE